MNKWVISIIILAVLAAAGFYISRPEPKSTTVDSPALNREADNFEQEGNLVRGNPGMKTDAWYLIYEKPGQPALNVELRFTGSSICVERGQENICNPDKLEPGRRARVAGGKDGEAVNVTRLEMN
jgi:hypothetical protein